MTKYRIVESYRYMYFHMDHPGYIIQVFKKYNDGPDLSYERWDDLFPINYNHQETAIEGLNDYIKRNKLLQKEEKVVYEIEII